MIKSMWFIIFVSVFVSCITSVIDTKYYDIHGHYYHHISFMADMADTFGDDDNLYIAGDTTPNLRTVGFSSPIISSHGYTFWYADTTITEANMVDVGGAVLIGLDSIPHTIMDTIQSIIHSDGVLYIDEMTSAAYFPYTDTYSVHTGYMVIDMTSFNDIRY